MTFGRRRGGRDAGTSAPSLLLDVSADDSRRAPLLEHGDSHSRILLFAVKAVRPSTLRHLLELGTLTGEALAEAESLPVDGEGRPR